VISRFKYVLLVLVAGLPTLDAESSTPIELENEYVKYVIAADSSGDSTRRLLRRGRWCKSGLR
jgi:hypothetical protein